MARLLNTPSFTGTVGPVCVYKLRGKYYVRTKSSLTAKRVKTAREFEKTRMYAAWLAQASKIASQVYREQRRKDKSLYRFLTG